MGDATPSGEVTPEEIIEHAIDAAVDNAETAAKYEGGQGAFFAGVRAAYAGVVEEFGTQEDFQEVLKRGGEATRSVKGGEADAE